MLFLIALVLAILFVHFGQNALKKYPYVFYGIAIALTLITCIPNYSFMPFWFQTYVIGLFSKGCMGTALFVIVMYTGCLKNGSKYIGPLMRIRGELSITAAFLVLSHNIVYGKTYFTLLFTNAAALPATQVAAAILSLIMITLMVILTITSFPAIRRKMNPRNWKRLQRSAYVFYGFLYLHIMLISIPYAKMNYVSSKINVVVYSIVFIGYAALRIRKALTKRMEESEKVINISSASVFMVLVFAVSIFAMVPAKVEKTESVAGIRDTESTEAVISEENTQATETTEVAEEVLSTEETEVAEENQTAGVKADAQSETGADQQSASENSNSSSASSGENSNTATQNTTSGQESSSQTATENAVARTYLADGVYTGSATITNYNYNVTVSVTISGDKITDVSFTTDDSGANATYIDMAGQICNRIKKKQTADVDAISGATYTSNAVKEAASAAINSAK